MRLGVFSIVLLLSASLFGQSYENGWAFGLGVQSPRLFGDAYSEYFDYGAHASIQKDIDEVDAFRLQFNYLHFTQSIGLTGLSKPPQNTAMALGLHYLLTFRECYALKVYGGGGLSALYFNLKDAGPGIKDGDHIGEMSVDILLGGKVTMSKDWEINGEIGFHQISTDKFDGVIGPGGSIFGGTLDSYLSFSGGLLFYLDRGRETKFCEMPTGIVKQDIVNNTNIDYDRIAKIVEAAKTASGEVDYNKIEDIVKRNSGGLNAGQVKNSENYSPKNNWVLMGINYDPGQSTFRPEAYPLLIHAAQILLSNPELKVEIQGHTDATGTVEANKVLSQERADAVKRFLVAKGVDSARLSAVGYGSANPIADNKTNEGKAFNRRIEFKVVQ